MRENSDEQVLVFEVYFLASFKASSRAFVLHAATISNLQQIYSVCSNFILFPATLFYLQQRFLICSNFILICSMSLVGHRKIELGFLFSSTRLKGTEHSADTFSLPPPPQNLGKFRWGGDREDWFCGRVVWALCSYIYVTMIIANHSLEEIALCLAADSTFA